MFFHSCACVLSRFCCWLVFPLAKEFYYVSLRKKKEKRTKSMIQNEARNSVLSGYMMHLTLELAGGAELLFGKQKKYSVDLPDDNNNNSPWTIRTLLVWMRENLLRERPELFIQGDSVRPGILVLINDIDWELLDGLNYQLKSNDNILFVSTLHGG